MSEDPAVDQLRTLLRQVCDREQPGHRLAMARTHFDAALYWLRVHREHRPTDQDARSATVNT